MKYVYKLTDKGFRLFDNFVGVIANKITKNPDTWKKISDKIDGMLINAKTSDIPPLKLGEVSNIKGVLGEKAKDEYILVVKEAMEKEGAEVIVEKGAPKAPYKHSQKYIAEYTDTGTGIAIFEKTVTGTRGRQVVEIDGLLIVNGKLVVVEAKAGIAKTIAKDLDSAEFFKKKIQTVEDLTGQRPEVLLLIPKGELNKPIGKSPTPKLSDKIGSLTKYLENEGSHLAYDEFPVGAGEFEKHARRIRELAKKEGK